jgi:hypothetical protein
MRIVPGIRVLAVSVRQESQGFLLNLIVSGGGILLQRQERVDTLTIIQEDDV